MRWTFRELFDDYFKERFKEKYGHLYMRLGRMIALIVFISFFGQMVIVPTESMSPTIEPKDFIFLYRHDEEYNRGDIVSFRAPFEEGVQYMKRIVGLEGERIAIHSGAVYINGVSLEEDYAVSSLDVEMEEVLIPADSYFMMGDNRDNSFDSREFGAIHQDEIVGRAIRTLYPLSRWSSLTTERD